MQRFKKKVTADSEKQLDKAPKKPNKDLPEFGQNEDRITQFIERLITIGCITSDEFLEWATTNFPTKYYESRIAKKLIGWCYEYFKDYKKSPKQDMENLYLTKADTLDKDLREELEEDILPGLSKEWEQQKEDINVKFLIREAQKHLQHRIVARRINDGIAFYNDGDMEECFALMGIDPIVSGDIRQYAYTLTELEAMKIEKPKLLIKPWLREGETNIFYGKAGVGKSLLALLMGYLLGVKEKDHDIGEWQIKGNTGCVYIDGELGLNEMKERLEQYKWMGIQEKRWEMKTFSLPHVQLESGQEFNLAKREKQQEIIKFLKDNPEYKFLILDSVSTVFGLENENDNSEWNKKVNPFLKDLRALGVSHIIVHHAGKMGTLRGASAMGAMAHNIFKLEDHAGKQKGEAWFTVDNNEKQRAAGSGFEKFGIHFMEYDGEGTTWQITGGNGTGNEEKLNKIMVDILRDEMRTKDIAQKYGCKPPYVSMVKKKAKEKGYLSEKGIKTDSGREFVKNQMEMEED